MLPGTPNWHPVLDKSETPVKLSHLIDTYQSDKRENVSCELIKTRSNFGDKCRKKRKAKQVLGGEVTKNGERVLPFGVEYLICGLIPLI